MKEVDRFLNYSSLIVVLAKFFNYPITWSSFLELHNKPLHSWIKRIGIHCLMVLERLRFKSKVVSTVHIPSIEESALKVCFFVLCFSPFVASFSWLETFLGLWSWNSNHCLLFSMSNLPLPHTSKDTSHWIYGQPG